MLIGVTDSAVAKQILRFSSTILHLRSVILRGRAFDDLEELVRTALLLLNTPWMRGGEPVLTREQRREARKRPPTIRNGTSLYCTDGAARSPGPGRHASRERQASWGAVYFGEPQHEVCGDPKEQAWGRLGDTTNNVAEYAAIEAALSRIWRQRHASACIQTDSMPVVQQLNTQWACRAATLRPRYAACVRLIQDIRQRGGEGSLLLEHIYRDWNTCADAAANHALDSDTDGSSSGWH